MSKIVLFVLQKDLRTNTTTGRIIASSCCSHSSCIQPTTIISSSLIIRSSSSSLSPIRRQQQQQQYQYKKSYNILPTNQQQQKLSTLVSSTRQNNNGDDEATTLSFLQQLPIQYLRALNPTNYNITTGQRNNVRINKINGKPLFDIVPTTTRPNNNNNNNNDGKCSSITIERCTYDDGYYHIWFDDGVNASYPQQIILDSIRYWKGDIPVLPPVGNDEAIKDTNNTATIRRIYWNNIDEQYIRQSSSSSSVLLNIPFTEIINDTKYQSEALKALYQYGIVLVTNTPLDDNGAGIAALASAISGSSIKNSKTSLLYHYQQQNQQQKKNQQNPTNENIIVLPNGTDGPMRTLYGMVWSTSIGGQPDGSSIADSAYTNDALPLHTDFTYYQTPPGLQIFTMNVVAPDGGGQSVFGDGFAMAEQLSIIDPEAFRILSTTIRKYRSIDVTTGWNLQATGPVIQLEPYNGTIQSIRHNDLDRLPDLPPHTITNVNEFYEQLQYAHYLWNEIIADDTYRLVMSLQKGDTIIVANQRCMHGRTSFIPPRAISGCYVSQDELDSRFRMEGYYC